MARDGRGSRAAIINNPIPSFLMVMTDASSSDGSAKYVRLVRKVRSILDIGYHGVAESHGRPPGRRVHEKSIRLVQSDMESASAVFQLYSPITVPTKEINLPAKGRSSRAVVVNRSFTARVGFVWVNPEEVTDTPARLRGPERGLDSSLKFRGRGGFCRWRGSGEEGASPWAWLYGEDGCDQAHGVSVFSM